MRRLAGAAALVVVAGCADEVTSPPQVARNAPLSPVEASPLVLGATNVVKPSAMDGWLSLPENTPGGTAAFVTGPAGAPLGSGSAEMTVSNSSQGYILALPGPFGGAPLGQLQVSYDTYRQSADAGNNLAIAVQFNLDHDVTALMDVITVDGIDDFQGRIVFEPYQTFGGGVSQGTWQTWDADQGRWWRSTNLATRTAIGGVTINDCTQSSPCTFSEFLTKWPNAGISAAQPGVILKAGSGWNSFTGNVDNLVVGVNGTNTTFDFEPETQCTTTCYVNAATGNNAFGGDTPASAKQTVQAALNQVSTGGTVRVFPGTYNESAPGSAPTSVGGTYQFGLFFASAKPGITLLGVDATDAAITDAASTLATINTNATNNFGFSGIFVEAINTTIQGLTIGPNTAGDNKTIEVVADGFTLRHSRTAVPVGGAIYLSEFDLPAGPITTYNILNNRFTDGTQIAISSGAGQTGPAAGRVISGNVFAMGGNTWPAISFNGTGGVPWYSKPVGGAVISGNTFSGGGLQYIRARGMYHEAQFDWQSWWTGNSYDKGTVALVTEAPFDVRSFSYVSAPYTFTNVRRIGTTVQGEVDLTQSGDVVLAKGGTYPETVTIPRALTLKGAGVGSTVLQGSGGPTTGISLAGGLTDVTIQQLTAQGYNMGIQMPTGPLTNITVQDVATTGNTTHGIWVQAFGITNMAFTRVTSSGNNAVGGLAGRGIWIINGVKNGISITDGTFNNNGLVGIDISDGNATGVTITGNTVIGNGDSGIGTLGLQGPLANLVSNNVVTNNGRFGIEIKNSAGNGALSGPGSLVVSNNVVTRDVAATDARDYAGIAVFQRLSGQAPVDGLLPANQPTGAVVTGNTVSGFLRKPVGSTGDGFGIVVEGTYQLVTKNLVSNNDVGVQIQDGNVPNAPSTPGFDRGNATPSSALVNRNSITGSTLHQVRNTGAPLTDATCNWYGAATGPAAGSISGLLTVNPWLVTSNLDGACGADNLGPITLTDAPAPAPIGVPITVTATISDLTTGNNPLLSWSWSRDGVTQGTTNFGTSAVTQAVSVNVPADVASDVDQICVWGTDVFGNVGASSCVLAVWYDPNAGFVTGGGWIDSPTGAYVADPGLTGRANFGFVSKYKKGNATPTGNTEFQFQAGNLNFSATAFQWLVVAGARAQFKGTGTINGTGSYSFILTAIDGALPGGGGSDKFRIKITGPGGLVYDNLLNAPDTADPTTELRGGSIVIHK